MSMFSTLIGRGLLAAAGLALAAGPAEPRPRLGGPGMGGGFSHMGAASSIHAPDAAPLGPLVGWDDDPFWNYPVATAAAVGAAAAAAVTSAALGSTVYALPGDCVTVFRGDLTYFQCGSVWYQPQYLGSGVTYVVVAPPP